MLSHGVIEVILVTIVNTDPCPFVGKASGKNCACVAATVAAHQFLAIKLAAVAMVRMIHIMCVTQLFYKGLVALASDYREILDCIK